MTGGVQRPQFTHRVMTIRAAEVREGDQILRARPDAPGKFRWLTVARAVHDRDHGATVLDVADGGSDETLCVPSDLAVTARRRPA